MKSRMVRIGTASFTCRRPSIYGASGYVINKGARVLDSIFKLVRLRDIKYRICT